MGSSPNVTWSVQVFKSGRWMTLDWAKNLTDQHKIEEARKKAAAEFGEENVRVTSSWEGKR